MKGMGTPCPQQLRLADALTEYLFVHRMWVLSYTWQSPSTDVWCWLVFLKETNDLLSYLTWLEVHRFAKIIQLDKCWLCAPTPSGQETHPPWCTQKLAHVYMSQPSPLKTQNRQPPKKEHLPTHLTLWCWDDIYDGWMGCFAPQGYTMPQEGGGKRGRTKKQPQSDKTCVLKNDQKEKKATKKWPRNTVNDLHPLAPPLLQDIEEFPRKQPIRKRPMNGSWKGLVN